MFLYEKLKKRYLVFREEVSLKIFLTETENRGILRFTGISSVYQGVVLVSTGIRKFGKPSVDRDHDKKRNLNINADDNSYAFAA